jgi:hypothetical protein
VSNSSLLASEIPAHGLSSTIYPEAEAKIVSTSRWLGVRVARSKRLPETAARRCGALSCLFSVPAMKRPLLSLDGSGNGMRSRSMSMISIVGQSGSCRAICNKYGLSDISISLQRSSSGLSMA